MCFPRGDITLAEELKGSRQGKVPQHNWMQSFAARICSSLQKTFHLFTVRRPSPQNLSVLLSPFSAWNLNPKGKTNKYVFCVIGRKGALIVSFCICIQLPKRILATGLSHVSGQRVVFASAWNKELLYSRTEVLEQIFFCSWGYMGLPPAQASKCEVI